MFLHRLFAMTHAPMAVPVSCLLKEVGEGNFIKRTAIYVQ